MVSTSTCRLRPFPLVPPIEATVAAGLGGLAALAVEDANRWFRVAFERVAHLVAQQEVRARRRRRAGELRL